MVFVNVGGQCVLIERIMTGIKKIGAAVMGGEQLENRVREGIADDEEIFPVGTAGMEDGLREVMALKIIA